MFRKVLVANRGEIAVRAFRAATELGAHTVAVFAHEDRHGEHRSKADEAYRIGEPGHPVRAYLDRRRDRAGRRASPAPTPSTPATASCRRTPASPQACADAGLTFVGPPASVLQLTGNKARAIEAARAAGLPVLASAPPEHRRRRARRGGRRHRLPGLRQGRRRWRRARHAAGRAPDTLRESIEAAMREAESAFGDPTVFLEQAVVSPGTSRCRSSPTATGNVIHLYERDCSVQRRHQKVVEIAPAPNLDPRSAATDVRPRRGLRARRSATSTPAPSSSCSPPTAATSSSR